jgi:hypothetical protein
VSIQHIPCLQTSQSTNTVVPQLPFRRRMEPLWLR